MFKKDKKEQKPQDKMQKSGSCTPSKPEQIKPKEPIKETTFKK